MASPLTDAFSPIKDAVTSGGSGGASTASIGVGVWLFVGIFVGIALLSVIGAMIWFFWSEKRRWPIQTRVFYENPSINGISLGGIIPTRRVRFKDGRVVFLYKRPIQGYRISPELLTLTAPRVYDVIVTQDKRLFSIIGITGINEQRKMLNVDVIHPDIEMDRQDLQHHIDSKKFDDPNEKLKLIAKVSMWIFGLVALIVLMVLGGKYYLDGKAIDEQRDKYNLQVTEKQVEVMEAVNTFVAIINNSYPGISIKGTTNKINTGGG